MVFTSKNSVRPNLTQPFDGGWTICRLGLVLFLTLSGSLPGGEVEPGLIEKSTPERAVDASPPIRQTGLRSVASPKVARYAKHLIEKYDLNRDGRLQSTEWKELHGQPELIDRDGDQEITLPELTQWITDYGQRKRIGVSMLPDNSNQVKNDLPSDSTALATTGDHATTSEGASGQERRRDLKFFVPGKRLPQGLPDWFLSKNLDGDGQLTAGEFSPTSLAAELTEFANLDANRDGILTAQECVRDSSGKTRKAKQPNPATP